jgi:hypothetical protein
MKVADFFQKARSAARNSHSEPRDVPPHQSQPNYYDDHPAAGRSRGKRTAGLTTAKLLYWLCWAAFFWFAYLNVNPYAQAASFILASISDNTLVQWFLSWPLIGPLLASLALAAHWIIGLIVWGVIQTIEVLPIILHHDRRFMRTVIAENGKAQRFAIAEDDSPTIRSLKKWYNLFPLAGRLQNPQVAQSHLCDRRPDLLPGLSSGSGWRQNLLFLLMTGQWYALDWGNIALSLVTLFAIEVLIHLLLFVGQIVYHYELSSQYQ